MRRRTWLLVGAAVAVPVVATIGVIAASGRTPAPSTTEPAASTMAVERGDLAALVSESGVLTYRARPDGSPYAVVNRASGTYTGLPAVGDQVGCGGVLYRVDDRAVLLLCGVVPAYRDLHRGDVGNDVHQLNQNLHGLGDASVDPADDVFTAATERALEALQLDRGLDATGVLALADAVFLPSSARIATVSAQLGGPAQPGAPVLDATSDALEVRVDLDPSQQGVVQAGDHVEITLLGNRSVTGKVDRIGLVVQPPAGPDGNAAPPTIPVHITLDDPTAARGLDRTPVSVAITTVGVEDALNVPVTAVVGKAGAGFAVEVVRDDGRHELVAVRLGLFDTSGGRVQVDGEVHAGDRVVVPAS